MAQKKNAVSQTAESAGRKKQEKPSEQPRLSAKDMRERLNKIALDCGFELMSDERYREILNEMPSVQFIPQRKTKKD